MRYLLIGLALLAMTCVFADSATMPINLTVSEYVYCATAANTPGVADWDHVTYGALTANDVKNSFNITVDGNGGSGSDTLNLALASNCHTHYFFSFAPGNLPGNWSMVFDGAGVTPLNQEFHSDPWDVCQKLVAPVTLTCAGVNVSTAAGSYAGALSFTTVPQ